MTLRQALTRACETCRLPRPCCCRGLIRWGRVRRSRGILRCLRVVLRMKSCPNCHSTYPSDFAVCPRDATTLIEVGVWSEGTLVRGKYRILSKIGVGGMAVVYKALHVRFDELRALKVMSPELAVDQSFVKRFMHEAVITRKLQHPNAVRLDDIDEAEDGRPFIVMEYIEGRSLKEVVQHEAPMAVDRVCSIAKQVAAALDAAHQLGMVHRDIKPANIVLVGRPPTSGAAALPERAKVLDFGIAKIKEANFEESRMRLPTLTGTGMVIGTPAYMSPEQAMGKRGEELDGRADVYSLGVVMYQMLAGELPLVADSEMKMLMAQINTIPPDIRTRRPDVPEAIGQVVMRCLQKMANHRPASAQALIEEIEYWEGEPVRLAAAKAEQERMARERAEVKRSEKEKAEQARIAEEMEQAVAKIRAERELRARERTEGEKRKVVYSDENRFTSLSATEGPLSARRQRIPSDREPVPHGARASNESGVSKLHYKTLAAIVLLGAVVVLGARYFAGPSASVTSVPHAINPSQPDGNSSNTGTMSQTPPPDSNAIQQTPMRDSPSSSLPANKQNTRAERATPVRNKAAGATGAEKQVRGLITEADVDYEDGLYADAIALYEKALKIDPKNLELPTKMQRAKRAKATEESLR
jgi:serine/threonine protein kinase